MKRPAFIACALALAACEKVGISDGTIESRLRAGDTTICAEREIQETLAEVLAGRETYEKFKQNGGQLPAFTAVSATGLNKDISEVSCSANVTIPRDFLLGGSGGVEWKVRPALDQGGGYIVETGQDDFGKVLAAYIGLVALKSPEPAPAQNEMEPTQAEPAQAEPAEEVPDMNVDEEFANRPANTMDE